MIGEDILKGMGRLAFFLFRAYFEVIELFIKRLVPSYNRSKYFGELIKSPYAKYLNDALELGPPTANIDERIKKIDDAKENLLDAIKAINELRSEADQNKLNLNQALDNLRIAEAEKQELSKKVETLKQVANADTEAFRQIVGIPSKKDIWKERFLGFGSGVIASLIASFLYLAVAKIFQIS